MTREVHFFDKKNGKKCPTEVVCLTTIMIKRPSLGVEDSPTLLPY
jgi:hypothetical protein